jgi:hypothetical protein
MKLPALKLPRLLPILAVVALTTLQFGTPRPAHADTYQLAVLGSDSEYFFYGMDDAGDVVFSLSNTAFCGPYADGCYATGNTLPGGSTVDAGLTTNSPGLYYDFTRGICVSPQPYSSPCIIGDNGRSAEIIKDPMGLEDLLAFSGSAAPQQLYHGGFGGIFAINGLGDIVFDDGIFDEWYEAIDLSTVSQATSPPLLAAPEPSTLLLLTTGILALGLTFRHRLAH